jgi:hypothetical protein
MNIDRFSLMGDAQAEAERASPEAVALRRQLLEFADVPSLHYVTPQKMQAFRDAFVMANPPSPARDEAVEMLDGLIAVWPGIYRRLKR